MLCCQSFKIKVQRNACFCFFRVACCVFIYSAAPSGVGRLRVWERWRLLLQGVVFPAVCACECMCVCTEGWTLRPLATRTTAHFLSSKTLNESSRKSFARSSELFAVSDVTPLSRLCGSRIAVPRAFLYCSAGLPSAAFEFMCMR